MRVTGVSSPVSCAPVEVFEDAMNKDCQRLHETYRYQKRAAGKIDDVDVMLTRLSPAEEYNSAFRGFVPSGMRVRVEWSGFEGAFQVAPTDESAETIEEIIGYFKAAVAHETQKMLACLAEDRQFFPSVFYPKSQQFSQVLFRPALKESPCDVPF